MDNNPETNLATYFRGISGNNKCPECKKDHTSFKELKEHLWGHRENEVGGPIAPKDRRRKCPHPGCKERIYNPGTSIERHFLTHTGEKGFACPHLSAWDSDHRELCGHITNSTYALERHRLHMHNYNVDLKTANHPWVDDEEGNLSEATLNFGNQQAEDHTIEVKEEAKEEELDEGHAQLDEAPLAQPPAPPALAPDNVQVLGNGANIQPQVQMPVNAQAQMHPPANIHLPVGPIINIPGVQHHNVPNHIPHLVPHVPHHRLPNGHIVGMQQHAPPPNPMPVILQEGERIVPIVENVRYYHSVPARFRRFHPVYNAFIDVPEYQLGMIRVVRGWRRVRTQPVHPPNGV